MIPFFKLFEMKKYSYRCFRCAVGFIVSVVVLTLAVACSDESATDNDPVIQLVPENGALVSDTVLPPGASVPVAVRALGGGSNITYFGIRMFDGTTHYVLDSGMNAASLNFNQILYKGNSPVEEWTFVMMNHDRQKASVTLTIGKKNVTGWGAISTLDHLELGAQSNMTAGGFLSMPAGEVYNYAQAAANQPGIDMIYYYGEYEATLSSPGESDAPAYFPDLASWSTKNETRYDTTSLSEQDFYRAFNDSLLIVSYEPVNGKRKAKNLTAGMVVAFRTQSGKIGLAFIKNVIPGAEGKLECAVKIQK